MHPPRTLPLPFTSSLTSTTRLQTQCVHSLFIQSRQFSASPSYQKRTIRLKRFTRQRRRLFGWLNTTGREFKVPRPDRTPMYLGAIKRSGPADKTFNASSVAMGQEGGAPPASKEEEEEATHSANFDPSLQERQEAEGQVRLIRERNRESQKQSRRISKVEMTPFPLNDTFQSQPVLSEAFREDIYLKVAEQKMTVRSVSINSGVSMERVAAVVRMKQMERDWLQRKKPLAAVYSRTILGMLPRTEWYPRQRVNLKTKAPLPTVWHESINDLPVHPATTQQIFHPVAESRAFTRADAGRAFHPKLLSADERIPHPEMIEIEKFKATEPSTWRLKELQEEVDTREKKAALKYLERKKKREQNIQVYQGQKYDFRFQDVSVEAVGKDGRARAGVGWRYGMPHEDRKPGQVKIPTHV